MAGAPPPVAVVPPIVNEEEIHIPTENVFYNVDEVVAAVRTARNDITLTPVIDGLYGVHAAGALPAVFYMAIFDTGTKKLEPTLFFSSDRLYYAKTTGYYDAPDISGGLITRATIHFKGIDNVGDPGVIKIRDNGEIKLKFKIHGLVMRAPLKNVFLHESLHGVPTAILPSAEELIWDIGRKDNPLSIYVTLYSEKKVSLKPIIYLERATGFKYMTADIEDPYGTFVGEEILNDGTRVNGFNPAHEIRIIYLIETDETQLQVRITAESKSLLILRDYVNAKFDHIARTIANDLSFEEHLEQMEDEKETHNTAELLVVNPAERDMWDVKEMNVKRFHEIYTNYLKTRPEPELVITFYKEADKAHIYPILWFPGFGYYSIGRYEVLMPTRNGVFRTKAFIITGTVDDMDTSIEMKIYQRDNLKYLHPLFSYKRVYPATDKPFNYELKLENIKHVLYQVVKRNRHETVRYAAEFFALYKETESNTRIYLVLFDEFRVKPRLVFFHKIANTYYVLDADDSIKEDDWPMLNLAGVKFYHKKLPIDVTFNGINLERLEIDYDKPEYYKNISYFYQDRVITIQAIIPENIEYGKFVDGLKKKKSLRFLSFDDLFRYYISHAERRGRERPFYITFLLETSGHYTYVPRLINGDYYTNLKMVAPTTANVHTTKELFEITGVSDDFTTISVIKDPTKKEPVVGFEIDSKVKGGVSIKGARDYPALDIRLGKEWFFTYTQASKYFEEVASAKGLTLFPIPDYGTAYDLLTAENAKHVTPSEIMYLSLYKDIAIQPYFQPYLWVISEEGKNLIADILPVELDNSGLDVVDLNKGQGSIKGVDDLRNVVVKFDTIGIPHIAISEGEQGEIISQVKAILSGKSMEIMYTNYEQQLPTGFNVDYVLDSSTFIKNYLEHLDAKGEIPKLFVIGFNAAGKFAPYVLFNKQGNDHYGLRAPLKGEVGVERLPIELDRFGADNDVVIYDYNDRGTIKVTFNTMTKHVIVHIQVKGKEVRELVHEEAPFELLLEEWAEEEGEERKEERKEKVREAMADIRIPVGFDKPMQDIITSTVGMFIEDREKVKNVKIHVTKTKENKFYASVISKGTPTSVVRIWTGITNSDENEHESAMTVALILQPYYTSLGYTRIGAYALKSTPVFLPYIEYSATRYYIMKMSFSASKTLILADEVNAIKNELTLLQNPLPKVISAFPDTESNMGVFGPYHVRVYVAPTPEAKTQVINLINSIFRQGVSSDAFIPFVVKAFDTEENVQTELTNLPFRIPYSPKFVTLITSGLVNLNTGISIFPVKRA